MKIYFIWCSYPTHAVFHGDPVGAVSLSGVARSLGHQTDISLYNGSKRNLGIIRKKITKNKYNIVGVSSNSVEKPLALELLSQLKGDFIKICGGLGPTFEPEEFQKHCDYIFVGEGERSFAKFLEQIENKQRINIPGVYSSGYIGNFVPAELTDDLDTLPMPNYEFKFDNNEVPRQFLATNIGIYMSSRGCPSACKFCFNAIFLKFFKGEYFRLKSAKKICQELDAMKKINPRIKSWNILDDTFLFHSVDDLEKISSRWYSMGTPFDIAARVIDIKPEKVAVLVKNGVRWFLIGVERATIELRNFCNKPYFTNKQLFEKMITLRDLEAPGVTISNMCGFSDETRISLVELLKLNVKIGNLFKDSSTIFQSVIYPLRLSPGSPWYQEYFYLIRKDFDPTRDRLLPNIKVPGMADEELTNWAYLWTSYIEFLVDLNDKNLQEFLIKDIEKFGPMMTKRREELLKQAFLDKKEKEGELWRYFYGIYLKVKYSLLFIRGPFIEKILWTKTSTFLEKLKNVFSANQKI